MHKIRVEPWRAKKKTGKTIVVISDTQIGFLRDVFKPEVKAPIHDLQAIELARKIVADVQPDQLGYIGDFLDLPEMSRWLQLPEFQATTQPSIDEGCRILDLFEAAAGPREKRDPTIFIAGNHDRRLAEYGIKNAKAAHYLRPGDETPEDWREKCGIPFLLGFEKRGIEYVGEYPGGEWWITPKLVARHNPEGPHAYGDDVSVMAGHTHALEQKTYSTRTKFGRRERTYYEIACLCSLNQYADPKSLQATVVPSNRALVKNWVNGFAIVHVDDDGLFTVELVKFEKRADGTMRCKRPTGVTYEVAPDWDTSPPAVAAAA